MIRKEDLRKGFSDWMHMAMSRMGIVKPRNRERRVTIMTNVNMRKCAEEELLEKKRIPSGERREYVMSDLEKEEATKILRDEYRISEGESECILYLDMDIEDMNLRVKLVHYSQLSPVEFEYALLKSERVAGCTGNMSLSQVLSSGRVPIYECLIHGRDFLKDLVRRWGEATNQKSPEKTFMIHKLGDLSVGYFKYCSKFWKRYRRFIRVLREDLFQKWFYDEVLLRVMMKLEESLEVGSELQSQMISIPFDRHAEYLKSMDIVTKGEVERDIEELRKSGNDIGVCLLKGKRISREMVSRTKILRVRECIEEAIEKVDKLKLADYNQGVISMLDEYLEMINKYEVELGKRLLKGDERS